MNNEGIMKIFPFNISSVLGNISDSVWNDTKEIRLRVNRPIIFQLYKGEYICKDIKITRLDLHNIVLKMADNSIYAVQNEICNGYITIEGGHRVGIVGQVVLENGNISNVKNFSSINIRIAREVKGISDKYIDKIVSVNGIKNTLIISPPGKGKTTLLRDLVRRISTDKPGVSVGVVDERSEIAGCINGVPQNDVGVRTDVIDSSSKSDGIKILVRSMSPKVIATDEIFSLEDADSILEAIASGVSVLCTAHGSSLEDVKKRQGIKRLINENIFENYILL